jgi:hypothetical protein
VHLDVKERTARQHMGAGHAADRDDAACGSDQGISSRQAGEEVTINAVPARDGSKQLGWINKITYADGHSFAPTGQ